jgi:mRNA-degrading endonuclease toxin of MazEF toxin-antitoxin module
VSAEYPLVKQGELWRLQTPISAANRVVLIISDTESDPVVGWIIGPQIASTFKGYLAERLGEVHPRTMMQVDAVLRAVLRLP